MALVLSPAQEIKVFADGRMVFAYSDGRWHLLDVPTQYAAWCEAVGECKPPDLASRTFQAALNDEFRGIIEGATGRQVRAFMSQLDPEHNIAAEIFFLEAS